MVSVCTYCGQVAAGSRDHVVPRHWLERASAAGMDGHTEFRVRHWIVPACRECNSAIGGRLTRTLKQRQEIARSYLRRKHKRLLAMPEWTDAELARMSPRMQENILAALSRRDAIRARLSWQMCVGLKMDEADVRELFSAALPERTGTDD